MKKIIFALAAFLGLMTQQGGAVETGTAFGVGIGALYSGIGVNIGLRGDGDFKYFAAGCPGIGYSNNSGWHLPCGIGAGWVWAGLLSEDDNRNSFGFYVGPVGIDNGNDDKASYGLGLTYVYFLQGINASGWNVGVTPAIAIGKAHGDTKGALLINVGYQF